MPRMRNSRISSTMVLARILAEIEPANAIGLTQLGRDASEGVAAHVKDNDPVRGIENAAHILLNDQQSDARVVERGQGAVDLVNKSWRERRRRLVEDDEFGRHDKGAGDRERALL